MRKAIVVLSVLFLAHGVANAAFINSSSDASLAGGPVINFTGATAGEYSSLAIGNVTFSATSGTTFVINTAYDGYYNNTGNSLQNMANYGTLVQSGNIGFSFGSAVSAFGFNWGASDTAWTLAAYGAGDVMLESYLLPITHASNAGEFYGIAVAGITRATLTGDAGDWIFVDNFTTSNSSAVPEPGTMILLGSGLIGLVAYGRRKKK